MKLKFYAASLLTILTGTAVADTAVAPQAAYIQPRADKSVLTDVIQTTQGFVVAGERGHILTSSDGRTWQQAAVPVQANLNSIYFINDNQGWAVGHDVSILHTSDAGKSWQIQKFAPELDKPLFDIVFQDDKNGLAVGAYGLMLRTTDGGSTWLQEFHDELANPDDQEVLAELKQTDPQAFQEEVNSVLPHLNRMIKTDAALYLVGEGGLFAISRDFGKSWLRHESFYQGSLFGIARSKAGTLVVAGLRGHAFVSRDDGQTWQPLTIGATATFNSVTATEDGFLLAGNSGNLWLSRDDAQTFKAVPQVDGKAVLNALKTNDQIIVVSEMGIRHNDVTAGKQ